MKNFIILFLILFTTTNVFAVVNYFVLDDTKIRDIALEIDTNAFELSEVTNVIASKNIKITGFWLRPDNYAIKFEPDIKDKKLKSELTKIFLPKLKFVIGEDFESFKKRYILTRSGKTLIYKDPSGVEDYSEFSVLESGDETRMNFKLPSGQVRITYHYAQIDDKKYIDKVNVMNAQGRQKTESMHEFTHSKLKEGYFPSKIISSYNQSLTADGGARYERNFTEILEFKNYKINTGEATRWFLKSK
jgi:hypothetical protein